MPSDGFSHGGDVIGFEKDDLAGIARADAELNPRGAIRDLGGDRHAKVFGGWLNAEPEGVAVESHAPFGIGDADVPADRRNNLGPARERKIVSTHRVLIMSETE
jgi:hypothetical protein